MQAKIYHSTGQNSEGSSTSSLSALNYVYIHLSWTEYFRAQENTKVFLTILSTK